MKLNLKTVVAWILGLMFVMHAEMALAQAPAAGQRWYRHSSTIEKERPSLNEETKRLIAAYRQNPTAANYAALRKQVAVNYDKVLARKKAKLEELKQTARHDSKIREMQDIVNEMIRERENRINQTMSRFTDSRLRPGARVAKNGFLPVLGAAPNVNIAYAPVTNAEYAVFVRETGNKPPRGWVNGTFPEGKHRHPVVNVSYNDALAYCAWLGKKDKTAVYRLPTATEWELAAGHMPKDADMNCGEENGTTPVDAYKQTLSAAGAIDMWGNVWEWTSSEIIAQNGKEKGQKVNAIKGGSWYSHRTSCRTEYRGEGRNPAFGYNTVGFRVIRETKSYMKTPPPQPRRRSVN